MEFKNKGNKRSREDATGSSLEPTSLFITKNDKIKRIHAQNIGPFSK